MQLHRSKGPNGSVVRIAPGDRTEEHYIRIRGAFHRVPHHIGNAIHQHQSATYQLLGMHRKMMATLGLLAVTLGALVGHFAR